MYTVDLKGIEDVIIKAYIEDLNGKKLLRKKGFKKDKEWRAISHFLDVFLSQSAFDDEVGAIRVEGDRAAEMAEKVVKEFISAMTLMGTSRMKTNLLRATGSYRRLKKAKAIPKGTAPQGKDLPGEEKLIRAEFLKVLFSFFCVAISAIYYIIRGTAIDEEGLPSGSISQAMKDLDLFKKVIRHYDAIFARATTDKQFMASLSQLEDEGKLGRRFYYNTPMSRMLGIIGTNILKDQDYLEDWRTLKDIDPEHPGQIEPWT